jgi:glutathionylspermidine synthase
MFKEDSASCIIIKDRDDEFAVALRNSTIKLYEFNADTASMTFKV